MSNELLNPFQQFFDDAGTEPPNPVDPQPLARGLIEFFENGQEVTQLTIFADSDLTVVQTNPYELDGFGRIRGDVHYQGLATIVISNQDGLRIRRVDDVTVSSDGNTDQITINADSVAAMVSNTALQLGNLVETQGYFAGNNYGGARYVVVAAGTGVADNFLFHNLGNGLQAALLERELHNDFLVAGARGDGGSNDTVAMQAVINQGGDVIVRGGFSFAATNLTIGENCRFVGGGTLRQLPASSGDLLQIIDRAVTRVKFRGVRFDGNQIAGNDGNAVVGWVI